MYNFSMPTQIKSFDSISEFIDNMRFTEKDLLITNAPIYEPLLQGRGLKCRLVYQENYGAGEPNDGMVRALLADQKDFSCDRIFALGGGTVIDIAKIMSVADAASFPAVLSGQAPPAKKHRLIAIPTTCGTGSEVSNIAVIEDTATHTKKAVVGPALFPDEAVLVPALLQGLPAGIFVLSSIDALVTAMESYLAPASGPITQMFAESAIQRILASYQIIARKGPAAQNEVVGQVLTASNFAGIAFCNTGVGAVHAMSYSLGGKYHVAHGEATYAFLVAVLRKYDELNPLGKIADLKRIISEVLDEKHAYHPFAVLTDTLNHILPLKRLQDYGVREEDLELFTGEVMALERLMKNNYVRLTRDDVLAVFRYRY